MFQGNGDFRKKSISVGRDRRKGLVVGPVRSFTFFRYNSNYFILLWICMLLRRFKMFEIEKKNVMTHF